MQHNRPSWYLEYVHSISQSMYRISQYLSWSRTTVLEEPLLLGSGVHYHPDWSILHRHTLEGHLRDQHCEALRYPASGSGPFYRSILAELWWVISLIYFLGLLCTIDLTRACFIQTCCLSTGAESFSSRNAMNQDSLLPGHQNV